MGEIGCVTTADCVAATESSVELLRTIAAVLDIRTVFPQVSAIANKLLSHNLLTMMFDDGQGRILIEAASTREFEGLSRIVKSEASTPGEGFFLIDDFATATLPVVDPADFRERIMAGQQNMGLAFWSKLPRAYTGEHVPIARRIADYVGLAVSHEQLAAAALQVADAQARAERLEARVRVLT